MQDILRETTPGFRLSELKTDPKGVSIFISLPQRHMADHFRWLRMITTLVITEMEKTRGTPKTGHPVLMCLDEFAGLKRMEVIENAAAQIAGFGVKLCIVVQNLVQLKNVYKDNWETFIGNAGTKLFFGIDDNFTREYLSKQMGETEIRRSTASESESRGVNHSETSGQSSSTSYTTGTNSSSSSSFTESQTFSPGPFWSTHVSSNFSSSSSFSSGSSSSSSTSNSTSSSTTHGTSESRTRGYSEGIHKRPLLTPEEIGLLFSRQDDRHNPAYPGLAVALLAGRAPIIMRRVNYDQDSLFVDCFDPHPDYPYIRFDDPHLRHARRHLYNLIRNRPAAVVELRPKLVSAYGAVLVDKAVRIYRRFERHDPDAKIVQDGAFSFARAKENETAMKLQSQNITALDFIESMDENPAKWTKHIRSSGGIENVWYGRGNATTIAGLKKHKRKGTIGPTDEIHLYILDTRHPWLKLFGVVIAAAVLQRAFRSYMFDEGITLNIGPTNLIVLGTMVATMSIVFLLMTKISGSRWVAGGALALLFFVVNLLTSWWPIS